MAQPAEAAAHRTAQAVQPLLYTAKGITPLPGVQKRCFELTSQTWPQNGMVQPVAWKHDVDIYIPADALPGRALLAVNNGVNIASVNGGAGSVADLKPASDFTEEMAAAIARQTKTVVVSVGNVPNQYLTMEAIVKTMDLAEKELRPWKIRTFVATGASKRAWGAWLAAIADTRIEAIAPFVLDVLKAQRKTENFDKLLQIEDPLRYLDGVHAQRLAIPKYIVNASGDDFFAPDNTRFYFNRLPGVKTLRVAPNSSHNGIAGFIESSLVAMINRMQRSAAWPTMRVLWTHTPEDNAGDMLKIVFSETPVKVVQWAADNPTARDFRYACGIRYQATPLAPAAGVTAPLATPREGWRASFVEAQFADGFVITTPVWVTPDSYPSAPPPELGPACKTLPES